MKTFTFIEPGKGLVSEKPVRDPGPSDVLVKVEMCGICGTDMRIWRGTEPSARQVTLGHEFSGQIVKIGDQVTHYHIGDRVVVDPNIYCHSCEYCLNGEVNLCENLKALGVDIDGGFAQYCVVPTTQLQLIPDSLSYQDAAFVEPIACALNGIERADIKPGQSVMIIGAGPIGLIMLQLVKLRGAGKVYLSEKVPWRRQKGLEMGADVALNPDDAPIAEQIPLKDRPKVVIECVGAPFTQAESIQIVKRGGTVVLFGDGHEGQKFEVGSYDFYYKNLVVKGAALNPFTQNRALNLLVGKRIDTAALLSRVISLDELPGLLEKGYGAEDIKVMVSPDL
jgi:2-desacetyl-2-hydroxyethyl bacteriochlorophyllide A dehydrogenase